MIGVSNRLVLMALAFVMAVAMACSGDAGPSLPEASEAATSTSTQPASAASTIESEPPATGAAQSSRPASASTTTPSTVSTPTGAARAVAPLREEPKGSSLAVIASRAVAVPSWSGSSLLLYGGYGSPQASPQSVPVEGGLTVSAVGSVTIAADEAYVIVLPEQRFGPSGPEQMTDADRQDIRDGLSEIGIPGGDIEFSHLARYGPSAIFVEVPLDELDDKEQQVLEAVETVIRHSESYGVIYTLTEENCEGALSLARREAIPAAERAADDLGDALGVERGAVMGALEYPLVNLAYGLGLATNLSCGAEPSSPYPNLMPFDAEPEVEVSVGLQITYRLQ